MSGLKKMKALYKTSRRDQGKSILFSEKVLAGLTEAVSSHSTLGCRRGCAHCCYLRVEAYDFEIDAITYYIKTKLNEQTRNTINTAIGVQYESIRKMTIEQHFHTNIKCPLLVNNTCSVYAVRPISCAAYHSLSENACQRSNEDPYDSSFPIPQVPGIERLKTDMHRFIQDDLHEEGPTEMISQLYLKLHA